MYSSFLGIGCVLDIFCVYRGILVIFCALWGYFGLIQVIEGILIFFRHLGGGGVTLFIFDVIGIL